MARRARRHNTVLLRVGLPKNHAAALFVADLAAGFGDQQRAGGNVPIVFGAEGQDDIDFTARQHGEARDLRRGKTFERLYARAFQLGTRL